MQTCCCVPMCAKTNGHRFPSDPDLRKAWIIAIKRDSWKPSAHSIVCKAHFKPDDYITETKYYGKCDSVYV